MQYELRLTVSDGVIGLVGWDLLQPGPERSARLDIATFPSIDSDFDGVIDDFVVLWETFFEAPCPQDIADAAFVDVDVGVADGRALVTLRDPANSCDPNAAVSGEEAPAVGFVLEGNPSFSEQVSFGMSHRVALTRDSSVIASLHLGEPCDGSSDACSARVSFVPQPLDAADPSVAVRAADIGCLEVGALRNMVALDAGAGLFGVVTLEGHDEPTTLRYVDEAPLVESTSGEPVILVSELFDMFDSGDPLHAFRSPLLPQRTYAFTTAATPFIDDDGTVIGAYDPNGVVVRFGCPLPSFP